MLSKLRLTTAKRAKTAWASCGLPIAVSVIVLFQGCGADTRNPGPQPRRDIRTRPPTPAVLPKIELRADLSEAPVRWELVASIPFGADEGELGFVDDRGGEAVPLLPSSFGVADDGSFWIVDGAKRRVAHFSRTGRFIDAVGGFESGPTTPRLKDIAVVQDRVYVVEDESARTTLTTIGPGDRRDSKPVTDASRPLAVSLLLPGLDRMIARIVGYAEPPGTGPTGYAEFPLEGSLRFLPGVPLDDDTWVDVTADGDEDLDFVSRRGGAEAIQPIHVSTFAGSPPRRIQGLVGPGIEAVFDEAVGLYVRASPSRPKDAQRFGGGAWYLRMGVDRSPLVWERLPEARVSDEEQVRHLAAGPDGRVYLMVPDKEGEKIYVRPER